MITKDEIQELLHSTETYRVERTTSTGDMDKFQEAICAFANDLPNSRKNGYLILGAYDNGELSGLKVTDDLLKKIAAIRSNGNILPIPVMSVDRFQFPEGDLLVAEVSPSDLPPVRYRGRTFIRIGPRRDIATEAEERILAERRMSFMATFDTMPCLAAKLNDINTDLLRTKYLIPLLGNELVESDTRPIEEQMAAVGMYDTEHQCPTYAAVVLFGYKPRRFMPGLYVQYVRFKGEDVHVWNRFWSCLLSRRNPFSFLSYARRWSATTPIRLSESFFSTPVCTAICRVIRHFAFMSLPAIWRF